MSRRSRVALPALILGSSVFLQLHLVLGLLLGPLAVRAFNQAKGPALAALAVLAAAMAAFWLTKRRRRANWTEAVCPACIGLRVLAERAPALAGLTGDDHAASWRAGGETPAAVRDKDEDHPERRTLFSLARLPTIRDR